MLIVVPKITITRLRGVVDVLGATERESAALPLTGGVLVMVTQLLLLPKFHAQPAGAVTITLAVPPDVGKLRSVRSSVKLHGTVRMMEAWPVWLLFGGK